MWASTSLVGACAADIVLTSRAANALIRIGVRFMLLPSWNGRRHHVGVEHHHDAYERCQYNALPEDGFENGRFVTLLMR
jgi:hypothetical protein